MSSSEDPTEQNKPSSEAEEFPVADVAVRSNRGALFLQSKMWWITLLCMALAIWLAWASLPETGPEITIRFPEGHGLKTGDVVRYRGIDVGVVTSVALNEMLSGVNVVVMLKPEGGRLNREGTRFWIVRPQLSLTEITGLETALGAKYIGVSPGDPAARHIDSFDGLHAPPPDELTAGGLQLVLRSDDRHGLNVGAPVTWRGVEVGQVLSVSLSPGARHVLAGIRINREYRRLVRDGSRFWVTSGFGVDVSLTGMKLNAQSLSTIIRGGISFITPADSNGADVQNGHVFALAKEPDEEWLKKSAAVPLIDFPLPTTVTLQYTQTTSILGIKRTREFTQTGLLIGDGGKKELLTAAVPESYDNPDNIVQLTRIRAGADPVMMKDFRKADCLVSGNGLMKIPITTEIDDPITSEASVTKPESPEECLVIRTAGTYD